MKQSGLFSEELPLTILWEMFICIMKDVSTVPLFFNELEKLISLSRIY